METNGSRARAAQLRTTLADMTNTLRTDAKSADDPRAQALFETSAEVLEGLRAAFEHYERSAEQAWR